MSNETIFFSIFILFILCMLSIDLGVFNKKIHVVSLKESLFWTMTWVGLSLGFYVIIYFHGNLIHGLETS